MNSESTLVFPFTFERDVREIRVSGEAYFRIAQHSQKPFVVRTAKGLIRVLGTEFNVNTYDSSKIAVALVTGAVQFTSLQGQTVVLKPGDQAVVSDNFQMNIGTFDSYQILGWLDGRYYFQNATLQDIVAVLPRWFGIDVVIDNPELATTGFTGMVNRNRPLTSFLNNLKVTQHIDYYFRDSVLHFK